MITAEELVHEIQRLPTFSANALELLSMLGSPDTDTAQLEKLLRADPALTANLLRLANSAYYRGQGEITGVRQAIGRLGHKQIYSLATSMAFASILPDTLPGYGIDSQAFWRHSLAVAVFSERIGAQVCAGEGGIAFTAGLLHDLGKLAIGVFLHRGASEVSTQLDGGALTFIDVERKLLGTDHAEVGYAIAKRWNLPEALSQAARFHHRPREASPGKAGDVCRVVHVANAMAHMFGYGSDIGELKRSLDAEVLRALALEPDVLQLIASAALEPIRDMGGVLQF